MATVRIGTCRWSCPSWGGLVYSAVKGVNHLAEYAQRCDTVEAKQRPCSLFAGSEPRLASPSPVDAYPPVPADSRFTFRVPSGNTLTHYRTRSQAERPVPNPHFLDADPSARFLGALGPMRDVLAPPMLQFGYLNRQHISG
ncbi:MAG: hypothetical protein AB7Y46_14120 [Armatimonadota bacterium]